MVVLAVAAPAAARGGGGVAPYRANDGGGFHDILPPGTKGRLNAVELGAFLATGARPRNSDDQLRRYRDLLYASPGLKPGELDRYFQDASFGVRPGDVASVYRPRPGVTIVRDRSAGLAHVYGATRAATELGMGYAAAEDRLFFMDVLRRAGRGRLSPFVGGAQRTFDEELWQVAPYTEQELERQFDQLDERYGAEGAQVQRDVRDYVAGVNEFIRRARLNPLLMPGEYLVLGYLGGPQPFVPADLVAGAALIGGELGAGGGAELKLADLLRSFEARFGRRLGGRLYSDFAAAEDPETPLTVKRRAFPYAVPPRRPARGSVALPDPGSVRPLRTVEQGTGPAAVPRAARVGFGSIRPLTGSNALLVSARESSSGHPLAVFGPQAGYFSPGQLVEVDAHGPGIDARGAAFAGLSLYVNLGRGRDYAWSATSAGQDIVDTFALDLCEPGGRRPTIDSMHYRFRGQCLPIEVLERKNAWRPNLADPTPAGEETLHAERTRLGLVTGRATIRGRPVAYAALRSTYGSELDSAIGFMMLNDPGRIRSAGDFQRAAARIGYTYNWFYTDAWDIAYFNSGWNPVRARGTDPLLPIRARRRFEWRGFDPHTGLARLTKPAAHPQVVNQRYLISWNNKQARGYRAPAPRLTSVFRSQLLEERVRRATSGGRTMTLPGLIDAMEDAATVDLRADKVLPLALRVIGRPRDAALAHAVSELRAWRRDGSHRIDRDRDGVYEHAEAIRLMDAWWPRWLRAEFAPLMGGRLFGKLRSVIGLDNAPNRSRPGLAHVGSAYEDGWYGYASKDLRTLVGEKVRGRYGRVFCGRGSRARCRGALESSLRQALAVPAAALYRDEACARQGRQGDQACFDAIEFQPVGALTEPLIPWQNRPTYQQAVEVERRVPG